MSFVHACSKKSLILKRFTKCCTRTTIFVKTFTYLVFLRSRLLILIRTSWLVLEVSLIAVHATHPLNKTECVEWHNKYRQKHQVNKTPAKAFTPPAESKMGTRPGRAVTREFIERGVYSLISVLPN